MISALILPPFSLILLGMVGCVLWNRRAILARRFIATALILLWISATPYFAESALRQLEAAPPLLKLQQGEVKFQQGEAQAIVILGAGTYFNPPEYQGRDTVSAATLVRLRYGAKLQRETQLPILVTGGNPVGNAVSEGQQMQAVLQQEFNVPVRWVEKSSDNTLENARNSYALLQPHGIKRIVLVTHAWHMPRAV